MPADENFGYVPLKWQVAKLHIFKPSILKSKVARLHQVPADKNFGYVLLKWQVARLHIFKAFVLKSKVARLHQVPADENFGYVFLLSLIHISEPTRPY